MKVIKESYEVSDELAKRLNSILADEFLASEAYRLAIVAMKGNKQHRLEEIAEKNGEDELEDHFKNLSEWMQSKGIKVVTDTDEMKEITNGSILKFKDGMSTNEENPSWYISDGSGLKMMSPPCSSTSFASRSISRG